MSFSKSLLLCVGFLIFTSLVAVDAVDDTLEEKTFGADVSDAVVRRITRSGVFSDDQNFLRRLAFTETRFGEDPKTYRDGYYGGIWQVDEDMFNLTKSVANGTNYYAEIQRRWGVDWTRTSWSDLLVPFHSGLAARLYLHHLVSTGSSIPGTIDAQAAYWVQHFRRNQTEQYFKDAVRRLESDVVCEGMMDICIVLDGSASITAPNFEKAKGFVADLVKTFNKDKTRVAFITYGNDAIKIFDFQHGLSDDEMDAIIRSTAYPNQNTNTPAGLLMAVDFFSAITPRNGIPRVVTTFTDGLTNRGNLPAATQAVRNASLTSFAVGITSEVDYAELLQIALLDMKRVFEVNDFDALAEFFYQMNAATCEVPQQPSLGTNQTGALPPNEKRYFQYPLPPTGLELHLETNGALEGWYSYSESTPSSAVYDGKIGKGINVIPPMSKEFIKRRQEDGDDEPQLYIVIKETSNSTEAEYGITAIVYQESSTTTTDPTTTTPTTTDPTTTTPTTTAETTTTPTTTAETTTTPTTTAETTTTPTTTAETTTTPTTTAETTTTPTTTAETTTTPTTTAPTTTYSEEPVTCVATFCSATTSILISTVVTLFYLK